MNLNLNKEKAKLVFDVIVYVINLKEDAIYFIKTAATTPMECSLVWVIKHNYVKKRREDITDAKK